MFLVSGFLFLVKDHLAVGNWNLEFGACFRVAGYRVQVAGYRFLLLVTWDLEFGICFKLQVASCKLRGEF